MARTIKAMAAAAGFMALPVALGLALGGETTAAVVTLALGLLCGAMVLVGGE